MILKKIILNNFRNFNTLVFEPVSGINYIYGLNGEGKTNIVEAISYLSLSKSYKNVTDKIIKNQEAEFFYVKGFLDTCTLEIGVNSNEKVRKKDGIIIHRSRDYVGNLKSVIFSIEDLTLVNGVPGDKRRYLDILLSQIEPLYLENAIVYKHLIEQKNTELKKEQPNQIYIMSLNEQLLQIMQYIQLKRAAFLDYINENITRVYNLLTQTTDCISVKYTSNVTEQLQLDEYIQYEIYKKTSFYGTHRDNFKIFINNFCAEDFASQGQQKILVLCLKILQCMYVIDKTKHIPIFILDDVFSELDYEKRELLLELLKDMSCQTFITTTEIYNKKDYVSYFKVQNKNIEKTPE